MPTKTTRTTKITKKTVEKLVEKKVEGPELSVLGVDGKSKAAVSVPKELFDAPVNKQLEAQAVRVYLANQRQGQSSTKTRGEVEGSTRKIYKQKGTGRARHGGIRAPIFVGGGIIFGPKPRNYGLSFPEKMKKVALASAFTTQRKANNIMVIDGLEDLKPKTKEFALAFGKTGADKNTLFILSKEGTNMARATRNLPYIERMPTRNLNTYAVLSHKKIVFTKDSLKELIQETKKIALKANQETLSEAK